jgi:cobalt-zinc-cadmium resistance protein CzcA
MLPAALATGIGSDVQRGLATVVSGGLILATLLTLFIIPTFYLVLERWAERRRAAVNGRPGWASPSATGHRVIKQEANTPPPENA